MSYEGIRVDNELDLRQNRIIYPAGNREGALVGLGPSTRRRCISAEDPPDEDSVRRRDRRRNPLSPVCREPGGRPRGRRLCVGVAHAELAGDLSMAEGRLGKRVSRRAESSVRRKGKWYEEGAAFLDGRRDIRERASPAFWRP